MDNGIRTAVGNGRISPGSHVTLSLFHDVQKIHTHRRVENGDIKDRY